MHHLSPNINYPALVHPSLRFPRRLGSVRSPRSSVVASDEGVIEGDEERTKVPGSVKRSLQKGLTTLAGEENY
jgi:hypothetical protein